MRRTASEKMEIIRLVEDTDLPVRATLRQLGVPRSTFYGWYQRYEADGFDGLHDQKPAPGRVGTRFPRRSRMKCSTWHSIERICRRGSWPAATRTKALLRVRIERLPHSEGGGPHHEPGLRADVGLGCVQEPDDPGPRDVADRLHVLPDHQLGLVLPVDGARRLLALHHRVEAQPDDGGDGCHRNARRGARDHRRRSGARQAPASAAERQRLGVRVGRAPGLPGRSVAWLTLAALRTTRRPRARSSATTGR